MTQAAKPKRNRTSSPKKRSSTSLGADTAAAKQGSVIPEPRSATSAVKAESKVARVIALLQRQQGASLGELVAETGWQPHTTRASLTGLRKKGHAISSDKVDGVRRYRAGAAQ